LSSVYNDQFTINNEILVDFESKNEVVTRIFPR